MQRSYVLLFSYVLSFFLPHHCLAITELRGKQSWIVWASEKYSKQTKTKKTRFSVLTVYMNTHPLFLFHSERGLIYITNYRASIK